MTQPEGAQSGAANPDSGGDVQGTGSTTGTGVETGGQGAPETTQQEPTVSRTDYDAMMNRLRAADKRASENEAALKQLRDKDLPEAEKLKRDYEEAVKQAAAQEQVIRSMRIDNAFLTDNTYKWRDPGAAKKLLDMSDVTVDSDGNVLGLKEALKKLATAYPWMLQDTKESMYRRFPAMKTRR
jgi:hypothetical protein